MAPAPDVLQQVLAVWRAALGAGDATARDDFFASGGTSLIAADIAAGLSSRLGIRVPLGEVLRAGTAERLARYLASSAATLERHPQPSPTAAAGGPAPATVQQQAIWFLEQLDEGNRAYNTVVAVELEGPVRIDVLERALAALVERHPILRTTFPVRQAVLRQDLHAHGVLLFDRVTTDEPDEPLASRLGELGRRRFDVARLPLICWTLVERAPDRYVLAQVEHHFVHDGWSMWRLLTELGRIYAALAADRPPALPALTLTYEDYGRWQQQWLRSADGERQRTWWTTLLRDAPHTLRFPNDDRRPPVFTSEGDTVRVQLSPRLRDCVRGAAARAAVTPFSVLMAAFAALVGSTVDADDLTLGSMLRNRRLPGSEQVVGMFVNTVALPVRSWRRLRFDDLARFLCSLLIEAQEHQELPFPIVGRSLALPRQLTRNPLFQVCFSMNDWPVQRLDFGPDLTARVSYPSNGGAKFDLDVVVDDPQAGTLLWRYYRPLFSRTDIVNLAARFENVLASCTTGNETPLGTLVTTTEASRRDVERI